MKNLLLKHSSPDISWEDLKQPRYIEMVRVLLDDGFDVRFTVTGRSMKPFLNGREAVTLRKTQPERYRTGDLVFYLNRFGAPVLHRVIQKKLSGRRITFVTQGDGSLCKDDPVAEKNILGRVIRIELMEQNASIDMIKHGWVAVNYTLACINRLGSKFKGLTLFPALHRRIFSTICRFYVFIAAK